MSKLYKKRAKKQEKNVFIFFLDIFKKKDNI